jgi:hypothetical protein
VSNSYRLTTSTSQVNSESEQYRRDFATFLSHNRAKHDFILAFLMEKFLNNVDNISTKDASSFQEVKNKFLNLHSPGSNGDSAHHILSNKKHKRSKTGPKSSGSSSSKLGPFFYSKDTTSSSKVNTCTWCTTPIFRKPPDMVSMSAPSLRSLISEFLWIRKKR